MKAKHIIIQALITLLFCTLLSYCLPMSDWKFWGLGLLYAAFGIANWEEGRDK